MRKHSFTLIEMLIVVVIIGILAAALIPRLQSVQARARDTKRKADLHQIGTALAIYKEDNGGYMKLHDYCNSRCDDTCAITTSTHNTNEYSGTPQHILNETLERYMTSIPMDPTISASWYTSSCDPIYGYGLAVLPRRKSMNAATYDSLIIAARTESDGSSSNRITNTKNIGGDTSSTGSISDPSLWNGSIAGWTHDANSCFAQAYQDYVCTTVTLDSGTTNTGPGTCTADKNSDDMRYIYIE